MVYPAIGGGENRPVQCYTYPSTPPGAIDKDAKGAAIAGCPRTCGYCCQTHAFSCQDKNVNMACSTVTQAQCLSPQWRDFLTEECPATCGYCDDCYDLNPGCGNRPEICRDPRMQDYVNVFCRRTCKKCTPRATATSTQRPTTSSQFTQTSKFTKPFTRPLTNF